MIKRRCSIGKGDNIYSLDIRSRFKKAYCHASYADILSNMFALLNAIYRIIYPKETE